MSNVKFDRMAAPLPHATVTDDDDHNNYVATFFGPKAVEHAEELIGLLSRNGSEHFTLTVSDAYCTHCLATFSDEAWNEGQDGKLMCPRCDAPKAGSIAATFAVYFTVTTDAERKRVTDVSWDFADSLQLDSGDEWEQDQKNRVANWVDANLAFPVRTASENAVDADPDLEA